MKKTQKARNDFCTKFGIAPEQTSLVQIAPALDIIQTRPADPAHSEYAGIARQSHSLLVETILTGDGARRYNDTLRKFPFPPGWVRLQSTLHHLNSIRMQEHGRASIIIPVLLRCHLQESWIRPEYRQAITKVFPGTVFRPVNLIVQCFADIARSNSVVLSRSISPETLKNMDRLVRQGRVAFQRLHAAAYEAALKGARSGSASRSPSPQATQARRGSTSSSS